MGKKLTVYLTEGTEFGPRLIEIGNWVGKGIYTPRVAVTQILVKTIHSVSDKPALGTIPEYVSSLRRSVGGLSEIASTIGALLIAERNDVSGYDPQLTTTRLQELLPVATADEIREAVDELESYGLVKAHKVLGNPPFGFVHVTGPYSLFLHFRNEGVDYDPETDIAQVAAVIVAKQEVDGHALVAHLNLPPSRVNRAVEYLDDYGIAKASRRMGTAPFSFKHIAADWRTKKVVHENSFGNPDTA
jgi:hypothetical protein